MVDDLVVSRSRLRSAVEALLEFLVGNSMFIRLKIIVYDVNVARNPFRVAAVVILLGERIVDQSFVFNPVRRFTVFVFLVVAAIGAPVGRVKSRQKQENRRQSQLQRQIFHHLRPA